MDSCDWFVIAVMVVFLGIMVGLVTWGYQDSQASRACREKLAVSTSQSTRSPADIAAICK